MCRVFSLTFWLAVSLFLFGFDSFAQKISPDLYQDVFEVATRNPRYPGGYQAMKRYLSRHLHYPDQAARLTVSGNVYLMFVVEPNGQLTQIELVKGLGFGCDEAALRIVQQMPHWIPGNRLGRPIRVKCYLSIAFGST